MCSSSSDVGIACKSPARSKSKDDRCYCACLAHSFFSDIFCPRAGVRTRIDRFWKLPHMPLFGKEKIAPMPLFGKKAAFQRGSMSLAYCIPLVLCYFSMVCETDALGLWGYDDDDDYNYRYNYRPSSNYDDDDDYSGTGGIIAGIVIGSLVGLCCVGAAVYFFCCSSDGPDCSCDCGSYSSPSFEDNGGGGSNDEGGCGCGRVFWILVGLVDLIFDGITARKIHMLEHPVEGEDYLGLAILLGLMSIISFLGVDIILGIYAPSQNGALSSGYSWLGGLLKWSQLQLCRCMIEDATTIYAVSRVGGVGEFNEGIEPQISLGFSLFQTGFCLLIFVLMVFAALMDCSCVSQSERDKAREQGPTLLIGLLVVMAMPITMIYYGAGSFGEAAPHIECEDSILDDDNMIDTTIPRCGTPNGGCPTFVYLLTLGVGGLMGFSTLTEDSDGSSA